MILLQTATTIQDKEVIWAFGMIILSLMSMGAAIIGIFYNGMMKRFDRLETKLDPLEIKVAIHDTEIINIKTDFDELNKWVGNHDGRLQSLERKTTHNN